ncbi:MAG: hypothetical protein ACYC8T_09530 [Myxococcaceae bacterium]
MRFLTTALLLLASLGAGQAPAQGLAGEDGGRPESAAPVVPSEASPDAGVPGPGAADAGGPAGPSTVTVALLAFESNKAAAEAAPAMSSLIASRLAESKRLKVISDRDVAASLGRERQRQLLGGCSDTSCMAELSGALGARYLVVGRLDRLGKTFLLTASLYDSQRSVSVAKPRAEVPTEDGLRRAADQVAAEMLLVLDGPPSGAVSAATADGGFGITLGLKLGNQFLASLAALNPGAELEVGWAFDPEWIAFLQVGFNLVRGERSGQDVRLTVVPSVLGARKLYRTAATLQPYWGVGMGLQLSFGQYGPFSETDSFPTVIGMFGTQVKLSDSFGALVEASINLAQLVLGLRSKDFGLGNGLNFDLSVGLLYRF